MSHSPRASIVSGYFSPLHVGHLDMFEAARARSGTLIVIVNNDAQQLLKKGRLIIPDTERLRIVQSMRVVDDALVSVDEDAWIDTTFDEVRRRYPDHDLEFCNGGDRPATTVPSAEAASAERNGIEMVYGVGGEEKADSSTRILEALEGGVQP